MNIFFRHILTILHVLGILFFAFFIANDWLQKILSTGLDFPLGPDPTLWGKAALHAQLNAPQTIPPTFPILSSVLSFSDSLVLGVYRVNALGIFLAIGGSALAVFYLLEKTWAGVVCSWSAAILCGYTLYWAPYIFYFQPECLALGVFSLVCLTTIWVIQSHKKHPSFSSLFLWGASVGLLFGTREHGIVVLLSILPTIVIVSHRRLRTLLIFCLGLQIGGSMAAGSPTQPFFFPHGGPNGTLTKASVAVRDSVMLVQGESGLTWLPNLDMAQVKVSGGIQKENPSDKKFLDFMTTQALDIGKDFIPSIGVALLGLFGIVFRYGWRKGMLVSTTFSPLIAALVVWTQWRHFFVLSSIFPILACGGILLLFPKKIRFLGSIVVLSISISIYKQWYPYQNNYFEVTLRREKNKASKYKNKVLIADYLRDTIPDGSVVIADDTIAILAKKPSIKLHQREIFSSQRPTWPNFIYRSYIVSNKRPGMFWESIKTFKGTTSQIFRFKRPPNVEERCLYGYWDGPIVENVPNHLDRPQPQNICPKTSKK
jgi:hypothetical protein